MKREIKTIKPLCCGCCPGHDEYPNDTYRNNRSKKQRAVYKAKEHRHSRRVLKQRLAVDEESLIDEITAEHPEAQAERSEPVGETK